eukprot:11794792-Prorocentrum_lima.AAC.1
MKKKGPEWDFVLEKKEAVTDAVSNKTQFVSNKFCSFCNKKFSYGAGAISVFRVRAHFAGIAGEGMLPCDKIPPNIRSRFLRMYNNKSQQSDAKKQHNLNRAMAEMGGAAPADLSSVPSKGQLSITKWLVPVDEKGVQLLAAEFFIENGIASMRLRAPLSSRWWPA